MEIVGYGETKKLLFTPGLKEEICSFTAEKTLSAIESHHEGSLY